MIFASNHPWLGGLFTDAELDEIFAPTLEIDRLLRVEAAWTRALGDVENNPGADAIAKKIESSVVAPSELERGFAKDGVPIPALVAHLKTALGDEAAHWIHRGLTSQDVIDTALMLTLADVIALFSKRLVHLDNQLQQLQSEYGSARLTAFTRMQPALETNANTVVGHWRKQITPLYEELQQAANHTKNIQWGGPIGQRSHPKAEALGPCFAQLLGLRDPGHAWHTDRRCISHVAHSLTGITVATGKLGEDVALMASLGPANITLRGGESSAMPHKNNPVTAEALITLSDLAATLHGGMLRSARHEGFRSGQAWTLEWLVLPQLCHAAGASLLLARELLGKIDQIGQAD